MPSPRPHLWAYARHRLSLPAVLIPAGRWIRLRSALQLLGLGAALELGPAATPPRRAALALAAAALMMVAQARLLEITRDYPRLPEITR